MAGIFLPPGNKWVCRKTTMEGKKELVEGRAGAKEAGRVQGCEPALLCAT